MPGGDRPAAAGRTPEPYYHDVSSDDLDLVPTKMLEHHFSAAVNACAARLGMSGADLCFRSSVCGLGTTDGGDGCHMLHPAEDMHTLTLMLDPAISCAPSHVVGPKVMSTIG
eukprot:734824-Prymnesium_polylepis.1